MQQKSILTDFVVRIKLGIVLKLDYVDVPKVYRNMVICNILYKNGLISYMKMKGLGIDKNYFRIGLKYMDNLPAIEDIKQITKFSKKGYYKRKNLVKKMYNQRRCSFYLISTNKGLFTNSDIFLYSKYNNLSGEV